MTRLAQLIRTNRTVERAHGVTHPDGTRHGRKPRCTNIARTDQHAARMFEHAGLLQAQADSGTAPTSLADRLRTEAQALAARAQKHIDTRITGRTAL